MFVLDICFFQIRHHRKLPALWLYILMVERYLF